MFKRLPGIGIQFKAYSNESTLRFVLGWENVPCVAEVVNRSLKADCTDFTRLGRTRYGSGNHAENYSSISASNKLKNVSMESSKLLCFNGISFCSKS